MGGPTEDASAAGVVSPSLERLSAEFDRATERAVGGASEVSVLFSGGIDSLLVAEAARRTTQVHLDTIGLPGSPEVEQAGRVAAHLELPWSLHAVTPAGIETLWTRLPAGWLPPTEPARSVATAVALAIRTSESSRLLCGQGADELFLGYARFRTLSEHQAQTRSEEDWTRLLNEDWPRSEVAAQTFGRTLASPYLDPAFVREVRNLPIRAHLPDRVTKPLLRRLATERGLGVEWVGAPKRAIQYGSGVHRVVAALDRAGPRRHA